MQRTGNVEISACVIVCNEAANLPRWLEAMIPLADELLVVDTGSTDDTVELAKAAGAKVEFFFWRDDFAAAKNFALDKCSGKWIVMPDADEYIQQGACAEIRAVIQQYDKDERVIGFVSPLINVDKDQDNAYISTIQQIRVFRNLSELRYVGSIHEMLQYSGTEKKNMPLIDTFVFYHTGYSRRLMPKKYQRNLQMLKESIEKYGKRVMDDFYLADCYYGLQQYDLAIQHAKTYLESPKRIQGEERRPYGLLLQSMLFRNYPLSEIMDWVKKALAEFPYGAEFKIIEGYAREAVGDETRAIQCYDEAEKIYARAKDSGERAWQTDEAGSAMSEMRAHLKTLLERQATKGERKMEDDSGRSAEQLKDKILAGLPKRADGKKLLVCENLPATVETFYRYSSGLTITICREMERKMLLEGKMDAGKQQYDYIYAGRMLEKTDVPEAFLASIRKMLAENGKAWFLLGNVHHVDILDQMVSQRFQGNSEVVREIFHPDIRHHYTPQDVGRMFSRSGYEHLLVDFVLQEVAEERCNLWRKRGVEFSTEDFNAVYWFITASRFDEKGVYLRSRYTEFVRLDLVKILRRIENGIDRRENISRLWQLCESEGIDFEYLQIFMQHSLIYYERTLQILAASLEDGE